MGKQLSRPEGQFDPLETFLIPQDTTLRRKIYEQSLGFYSFKRLDELFICAIIQAHLELLDETRYLASVSKNDAFGDVFSFYAKESKVRLKTARPFELEIQGPYNRLQTTLSDDGKDVCKRYLEFLEAYIKGDGVQEFVQFAEFILQKDYMWDLEPEVKALCFFALRVHVDFLNLTKVVPDISSKIPGYGKKVAAFWQGLSNLVIKRKKGDVKTKATTNLLLTWFDTYIKPQRILTVTYDSGRLFNEEAFTVEKLKQRAKVIDAIKEDYDEL